MKVFYIYLAIEKRLDILTRDILNPRVECDEDDYFDYTLFGITNDKDMLKDFFTIYDKKKFKVITKDMEKGEYDATCIKHSAVTLEYQSIDNYEIPMNKYQYDVLILELIPEVCIFDGVNFSPYHFLKQEYIEALDLLLYCTIFYMENNDDEDTGYAVADAFYGYGCIAENTKQGMSYYLREMPIFMFYYSYILKDGIDSEAISSICNN